MPKRSDDYHGGGSGWRFEWRPDRLQRLHELGQDFDLTEDSVVHGEPLAEFESDSHETITQPDSE